MIQTVADDRLIIVGHINSLRGEICMVLCNTSLYGVSVSGPAASDKRARHARTPVQRNRRAAGPVVQIYDGPPARRTDLRPAGSVDVFDHVFIDFSKSHEEMEELCTTRAKRQIIPKHRATARACDTGFPLANPCRGIDGPPARRTDLRRAAGPSYRPTTCRIGGRTLHHEGQRAIYTQAQSSSKSM